MPVVRVNSITIVNVVSEKKIRDITFLLLLGTCAILRFVVVRCDRVCFWGKRVKLRQQVLPKCRHTCTKFKSSHPGSPYA